MKCPRCGREAIEIETYSKQKHGETYEYLVMCKVCKEIIKGFDTLIDAYNWMHGL